MNKNKGFTLIELMGILVVLSLILIIAVPTITKTLQGTKEQERKDYEKMVCEAARSYVHVERNRFPDIFSTDETEKTFVLPVLELKDEGYITDTTTNPSDFSDSETKAVLSGSIANLACVVAYGSLNPWPNAEIKNGGWTCSAGTCGNNKMIWDITPNSDGDSAKIVISFTGSSSFNGSLYVNGVKTGPDMNSSSKNTITLSTRNMTPYDGFYIFKVEFKTGSFTLKGEVNVAVPAEI